MVNAYYFKENLRLALAQENFKCSEALHFLKKLSDVFPQFKTILKMYVTLPTICEGEKKKKKDCHIGHKWKFFNHIKGNNLWVFSIENIKKLSLEKAIKVFTARKYWGGNFGNIVEVSQADN